LTFPAIPNGSAGATYARFRLSTDGAAADPTGAATGGEVEDYAFAITDSSDGSISGTAKLASGTGNVPALADNDEFGSAVASLGALDGDGITDLAVSARNDDTGGTDRGAVYVLLMNANGTAKNSVKIASGTNGGPTLVDGDEFGAAVASLGDLNGDSVPDLVVGAQHDGGSGAVYVLLMNADGTAQSSVKIASGVGGGPTLALDDRFGLTVDSLGDLDSDGVTDLAVGAYRDDTGGEDAGALYVLMLNADGTAKESVKIASGTGGGPVLAAGDWFGRSVAARGDLDGDGIGDLVVGGRADDTGQSHLIFGISIAWNERKSSGVCLRRLKLTPCTEHSRWHGFVLL